MKDEKLYIVHMLECAEPHSGNPVETGYGFRDVLIEEVQSRDQWSVTMLRNR